MESLRNYFWWWCAHHEGLKYSQFTPHSLTVDNRRHFHELNQILAVCLDLAFRRWLAHQFRRKPVTMSIFKDVNYLPALSMMFLCRSLDRAENTKRRHPPSSSFESRFLSCTSCIVSFFFPNWHTKQFSASSQVLIFSVEVFNTNEIFCNSKPLRVAWAWDDGREGRVKVIAADFLVRSREFNIKLRRKWWCFCTSKLCGPARL